MALPTCALPRRTARSPPTRGHRDRPRTPLVDRPPDRPVGTLGARPVLRLATQRPTRGPLLQSRLPRQAKNGVAHAAPDPRRRPGAVPHPAAPRPRSRGRAEERPSALRTACWWPRRSRTGARRRLPDARVGRIRPCWRQPAIGELSPCPWPALVSRAAREGRRDGG